MEKDLSDIACDRAKYHSTTIVKLPSVGSQKTQPDRSD